MIFASDLDQTLIYSEKHIDDCYKDKAFPIEYKDDRIISYILHDTLQKLRDIKDKLIFIPTTTRTLEQYERIMAFKPDLSPTYAVVNHGGTVLINGIPDLKWEEKIRQAINSQCESISFIKELFKREIASDSWVLDIRQVEELFFYCILDLDKTPNTMLQSFMGEVLKYNWQSCLHGRKLYFIPKPINKWNAIEYIKSMLPDQELAASGDSFMDFELLDMADYAILPSHGEICSRLIEGERCIITQEKGIGASLEIVSIVEGLLKSCNE